MELGKDVITAGEFEAQENLDANAVSERFGGWNKALARAGLTQAKLGRRYTDEACFENLLLVWKHYARPPKHDEMKVPPSTIGPKAYVLRWGTWLKTLHAFAQRVNEEPVAGTQMPDTIPQPPVTKERGVPAPSPDGDKRQIPLGLRYRILVRDRFRCVIYGRSPATSLGIELQIDHIFPSSKGGRTIPENLRTTCSECNLGKSNRVEDAQGA